MDTTKTLETVATWPVEAQLDLLFRLWDQLIDGGWMPTPTDALIAELNRRIAAHEADPTRTLTWDQVVAHVKRAR